MNIQEGANVISNRVVDAIIKRLDLPAVPDEEESFCSFMEDPELITLTVTRGQLCELYADIQNTMFNFIKLHPELYEDGLEENNS